MKYTQKVLVTGEDFGPAVKKTIIKLDQAIDLIDMNNLKVIEEKNAVVDKLTGEEGIIRTEREIIDAYVSNEYGNKVNNASQYITIEMSISPRIGSPFIFHEIIQLNNWCKPYRLHISGMEVDPDIDVEKEGKLCPQLDNWTMNSYLALDGTQYAYAQYRPSLDGNKHPLVIWLHGLGEGGIDPSIDLLANKVTAMADIPFQKCMKGAYVLVPQCPTMWMDNGKGDYQSDTKDSIYTKSLFELIDSYVKENRDIDMNRIYIGGCSNGGYMTMEMLLHFPYYFAAAFPICEAYQDQYITDAEIDAIKDLPIWFTYAKTDTTVDYTLCTEPTVKRLLAAGAKNVHVSSFDKVVDTTGEYKNEDGSAYEYNGHWSWIYWDNNECYEGDLNAWKWLGQQAKTTSVVVTPTTKPTTKPGTDTKTDTKTDSTVKTGDETALTGLSFMMLASAGSYIYLKRREQVR